MRMLSTELNKRGQAAVYCCRICCQFQTAKLLAGARRVCESIENKPRLIGLYIQAVQAAQKPQGFLIILTI